MKTVLLIDDDAMSRELFSVLLEAEGYIVHAASSGDAALSQLTGHTLQPDAVLADMQMPGLAGSALASALRAQLPQAVILGMSASQPAETSLRGFDRFLLKPFNGSQFTAALTSTPSVEKAAASAPDLQLDERIVSGLTAVMAPAQLNQLYALCLADARSRIDRMRTAIQASDDTTFRKEGHALKGGSSMLGAVTLSTLARRMEDGGINADASRLLDEFLAAAQALEGILLIRFPVL